jgi:hypothetical protein
MRTTLGILLAVAMLGGRTAGQSAPMPDSARFLREAREQLARSQEVWHQYVYKERRTDVQINPFGKMGVTGTRVLEIYRPANPALGYRHVIERNGVAVPHHEIERMRTDYRARLQAELRGNGEAAEVRQKREREDLLARRRAQMVIADVLDTMKFEVVRRETRHGVPAIVVGFSAKPDARPTTRQGRIATVLKGEAWVHEASREVMSVEAVAVDDVSFGGFIAKLYEGTRAAIERKEIEPGVWMPIHVKLTGDIRALFRKATIDYVVDWYDYRRVPNPESLLK